MKITVISHESDFTPGLANKISKKYASKICLNFPDTLKQVPSPLGVYTGTPIRESLFSGDKENVRKILGFDDKPVILIMGGSSGATAINNAVREALNVLLEKYNIVHLCGKGKVDNTLVSLNGYAQFEYLSNELPDYLALADIIISRAGANAIHEFLALKKPMILIPLPLSASRGDQILNANSFKERGIAKVLFEEDLNTDSLIKIINETESEKISLIDKMSQSNIPNGTEKVLEVIQNEIKK